jgi:hypothetical protein
MKGKNFMLEDRTWVKNLINSRDDDEIIIPLYVQIYGKKYPLLKLDEIKKRFSPSAFKVGYGTADAWFMKNSFPVHRISEFDLVDTFSEYDSKNERNIRYTVFESGDVDTSEENKLNGEIHMYFDLLFNNVKERVDAYFRSLIESENVPIVPEDKPEKEEVPLQVGIKEYTGELSEYSSSSIWDPKFVNEDDEEDPLEELRKEVAEYSQDDEDDKLLIVETDNTGTEIVSATEATLDLPKDVEIGDGLVDMFGNEVNDDYLSEEDGYPRVTEGGIIGKETVDFINEEGKYSDNNEDYSTDFDVF